MLRQGPEFCAALNGGTVPGIEEWLQWVEVSVARMTTPQQFGDGKWMVKMFTENGCAVINVRRFDGGRQRRIGELERVVAAFTSSRVYELYPAESRLVDAGNEYHFWVPPEAGWLQEWEEALQAKVKPPERTGGLGKASTHYLRLECAPAEVRKMLGFQEEDGEVWHAGEASWVGVLQCEEWVRLRVWCRDAGFRAPWSEIQRLKNELVGPENEGVEVFGNVSGVVNPGGRAEVWVHALPGVRFPFGYGNRWVLGAGLTPVFRAQAPRSESQRAASA